MNTTTALAAIEPDTLASFAFPETVGVTEYGDGLRTIAWTETEGVHVEVYTDDSRPFGNAELDRGSSYWDDLIREAERFLATSMGAGTRSYMRFRFHTRFGRVSGYADLMDRVRFQSPNVAHRADEKSRAMLVCYDLIRDLQRAVDLVRFARGEDIR